jgi:hypothetical protein
MIENYSLSTSPTTISLGPDTFATVDVANGSNPVVVSWYTLAGHQRATITAGNGKKFVPSDGLITLMAESGNASASVSAERMGAGKMIPAAPNAAPNPFHLRTASFTRPADTAPYAAGDFVANSTVAGQVLPLIFAPPVSNPAGGGGVIRRARLRTSSLINLDGRLHLFTEQLALGTLVDNNPWSAPGSSSWVGTLDINARTAFTDGVSGIGVSNQGGGIPVLAGQTLYGYLLTSSARNPASAEILSLGLEAYRW